LEERLGDELIAALAAHIDCALPHMCVVTARSARTPGQRPVMFAM